MCLPWFSIPWWLRVVAMAMPTVLLVVSVALDQYALAYIKYGGVLRVCSILYDLLLLMFA